MPGRASGPEGARRHGLEVVLVRGNHDRVCAGLDSADYFNRYAREAAVWTLDQLHERNLAYLKSLPEGPLALGDEVAICHGSSIDEDAYVFSAYDAQLAFAGLPHRVILFGHTHVPSMFILREQNGSQTLKVRLLTGRRMVLDLDDDCRYLINPGSVGQPRDRENGDEPHGHHDERGPGLATGSAAHAGLAVCSRAHVRLPCLNALAGCPYR